VALTDLLAEGIHALVPHLSAETWKSSFPDVQMCVPKESSCPGSKTPSNDHCNAERPSLVLPRGSLFTVAPQVRCLNVLRMVVSARSYHPSRVNTIGHNVAIVGEHYLANSASPVLLNYFPIGQFPHSALERSSRYPRGWCKSSIRCTPSLLTPLPFGTGSRPQQESDRWMGQY
jgi:hypothetical protein